MPPTPGPIADPGSPSPATAAGSSRDAAQSTEFSGNTTGHHARIQLGPTIYSNGYGQSTAETGSSGHRLANDSDLEWLHRAYQNEPRRCQKVLNGCHCHQPSTQDDFLLGFANIRALHTWRRESHHLPLWVQKGTSSGSQGHKHLALCVLKQAIRAGATEDGRIFTYSHRSDTAVVLPKAYSIETSRIPKQELSSRYSVEILLLSIFMQAKAKGLELELHDIDTRPGFLVDSLTSMLASALRKMEDPAYIVLDELFEGEGEEHGMSERLVKTVVDVLKQSSHKCLLMISARESQSTSQYLGGYPLVKSDLELQECLQSLQVPGGGIRRVEIADPVPESNCWVWDRPALQRLRDSQSGALAIIGKAGSGKSVLGKTISQGLHTHWTQPSKSSRPSLVGEWFYCRRRGETFTTYRSLLKFTLSKFLARDNSIFTYCKSIYRRDPPASPRSWAVEDLEQVLRGIVTDSVPLMMVFDAIDESDDDRMVKLAESLVNDPRSRTKVIFLSRPMVQFETAFWESRQLVLQKENQGDIQKAVKHGLDKLNSIVYEGEPDDDGGLPIRTHAALRQAQSNRIRTPHMPKGGGKGAEPSGFKNIIMRARAPKDLTSRPTQPSQRTPQERLEGSENGLRSGLDVVERQVVDRADGVMLWVVLVFENLYTFALAKGAPPLEDELLSIVDQFPRELNDFYGHMVEKLTNSMSRKELETVHSTLKWVNLASQHKRFTVGELWDALAVDEWVKHRSSTHTEAHPIFGSRKPWYEFQTFLRQLSGSFVEILPPTKMTTIMKKQNPLPHQHRLDGTIHRLWGSLTKHIWPTRDTVTEDGDLVDMSEDSVVQLMHQTVKDFLTSPERTGGNFSLSEDDISEEVLQASTTYVKLALSDDLYSLRSFGPDTRARWSTFAAKAVRYLDDFRLLPFCFQLLQSSTDFPEPCMNLVRSALLPDPLMIEGGEHTDELRAFGCRPGQDFIPTVLGFVFFFATETGLKHGALNYLRVINLGKGLDWRSDKHTRIPGLDWGREQNRLLSAMSFGSIMTLEFHRHPYQICREGDYYGYLAKRWELEPYIWEGSMRYLRRIPNRKQNFLRSAFYKYAVRRNYTIRNSINLFLDYEDVNLFEKAEEYLSLLSMCAGDEVPTKSKVVTNAETHLLYEDTDVEQILTIIENGKEIASIMSSLLERSE